ncbi:MAG: ATP-dependent helicase [Deltaproteobacteria bacterium]|jgi:superfamily I DNA/RNA helicase|nr:ATP-dependent helicase [Deltaproteobacteria bacterium]
MDYLDRLNESQKEAALRTEGPVRVAAGPGTGKTRAIVARYCHLVDGLGIPPRNILCVTFTNKAADEMRRRVRSVLGGDMDLGLVCTFHSFCRLMLKDEIHRLNYPPSFPVLDREDQKTALGKIYAEMGLSARDLTFNDAIDNILEAKKLTLDYVGDYMLAWEGPGAPAVPDIPRGGVRIDPLKAELARGDLERDRRIFLSYLREQKRCYALDFNDLLNFGLYVLEMFPEARDAWQSRLQYVMVDEFQDVSAKQYRLAKILSGGHGNLFIVGDSDQTIYSWRGSHLKMFMDFPERHKGTATFALSVNYRSTPQVLAAAGALISRNTGRFINPLAASLPDGERPVYFNGKTDREAAEWILGETLRIRDSGTPLNDVAVLCRSGHMTRPIEGAFMAAKVPCRILCGMPFYRRREVKTAVSYLRMLVHGDDMAFQRTVNSPSRQLGRKTLDMIREEADRKGISHYEALKNAALALPQLWRKVWPGYVQVIEDLRRKLVDARGGMEPPRLGGAVQGFGGSLPGLAGAVSDNGAEVRGSRGAGQGRGGTLPVPGGAVPGNGAEVRGIAGAFPRTGDAGHNGRADARARGGAAAGRGLRGRELGDLFEELLDRTGFEESLRRQGDDTRLDNLAELKRGLIEFAEDPEATLEDFLDRAALYTNADAEGTSDAVSIMTIHAAKGLEFDSVVVCGLNEGLFPSSRCETPEDMEEERRILYVAVTRAKRRLKLVGSERAVQQAPVRRPSRFLVEMASELDGARPKDLELLLAQAPPGEASGDEGRSRRPPAIGLAPAFSEGDAVEHASFGRGKILAVNRKESAYRVKFEALSTPRDIMFGSNLRKA